MTISPNRVIQSVNSQESLRHQISIDQTNQLTHQPITAKSFSRQLLHLTGLAGVGSKSDNQIHGAWLSGGTKALPILLGHERWRLPPSQDCPDFQQTVSRSCRLELLSARRRRGISDLDRCSSWMVFPSSIKLDVHSIYLPPASGSILQMQH